MIPAAELAALQAEYTRSLDLVCAIQRNSGLGTSDNYGTVPGTWTTVAGLGAVPCSLSDPSSSYEQNLASQRGNQAAWTISVPKGTDIRQRDRVVIGADTWTVQAVEEPHSYPLTTQALISEVR